MSTMRTGGGSEDRKGYWEKRRRRRWISSVPLKNLLKSWAEKEQGCRRRKGLQEAVGKQVGDMFFGIGFPKEGEVELFHKDVCITERMN